MLEAFHKDWVWIKNREFRPATSELLGILPQNKLSAKSTVGLDAGEEYEILVAEDIPENDT